MQKDIILYKRKNNFLRFIGLVIAGICAFTICMGIVDSIYTKTPVN